jgi:Flp pilus assembly pilin Flp
MLRNLLKNKKAQNTAEYALLIALVVAGVIAMQTFAQRALQARIGDASTYMASQTNAIGNHTQYEPYYQQSDYEQTSNSTSTKELIGNQQIGSVISESDDQRSRTGFQRSTYGEADRNRV